MHPNNSAQKPNIDLTPEILKEFIEVQKQKTFNDTKELHLREKELELSARQTEKAMDHCFHSPGRYVRSACFNTSSL